MTNILITAAGAGPSISIIKALRRRSGLQYPLNIVAADMESSAAGLYLANSFVISPPADTPEEFISFIKRTCLSYDIDFVMCPFDIENILISKHKEEIYNETRAIVLCNSHEATMRCSNKLLSIDTCKKHGVRVPETYVGGVPSILRHPLIIKPVVGFGSKGNRVIHKWDALKSTSLGENLFCQELISGTEYTIDILSDMEGKPLAALPRERVVVKSGQTVKGRVTKDKDLVEYGLNLAKIFSLEGVSCAQCIRNDEGIFFIEMNPRYGTGVSLACGAGIDMPFLHLKLALGEPVLDEELTYKDRVFMTRYHEEIFIK